jgi:hypothetical protein
MQPLAEYVFYCEECKRKVQHVITLEPETGRVFLDCENGHVVAYPIADLVMCYTTHCEDESSYP